VSVGAGGDLHALVGGAEDLAFTHDVGRRGEVGAGA
jgi:hypothetical protein